MYVYMYICIYGCNLYLVKNQGATNLLSGPWEEPLHVAFPSDLQMLLCHMHERQPCLTKNSGFAHPSCKYSIGIQLQLR